MDFADMEYGVIKSGCGVVIIVKGKFHGPFNQQQLGRLIELMELMEREVNEGN